MKHFTIVLSILLVAPIVLGLTSERAMAQDPTKVDTAHYAVVFENDHVRVVRIAYGPGEKSVMHYHPANVAVFLTDNKVLMTLPDETTAELNGKAGDAVWAPAGNHLPKNVGEKAFELILIEMKSGDAKEE